MKLYLPTVIFFFTTFLFGQSFHDTQGKLEITNSGQATFTLPIAMPPSIKDVGPVVNLNYASGQFGGIAGQGWSINSISTITRISTRQDIDGFRDGVDYDKNDKLALDGQRLLIKSGTYWENGSVYETEVQSNTKVELFKEGIDNIYFIVTTPDGSRTWYGKYGNLNGTDVNVYYVVRFEDIYANYINYLYSSPYGNNLCISEIQFSANSDLNVPLNRIVFEYEQVKRREFAYIKGVLIRKLELLKNVKVFTDNNLFRNYQLIHGVDEFGYQRIFKIIESNGNGEQANPIRFSYDDSKNEVNETTAPFNDGFNLTEENQISGDYDGDGKCDFVSGNKMYTKLFMESTMVTNSMGFAINKRKSFNATTLKGKFVNQKQSFVKVEEGLNNLVFKIYNLENNQVVNTYDKNVAFDNKGQCDDLCTPDAGMCTVTLYDDNNQPYIYSYPCPTVSKCPSPYFIRDTNKYLEGDYNGDGLSEVIVLGYMQLERYTAVNTSVSASERNPPIGISCNYYKQTYETISNAHLISLIPGTSGSFNSIGNIGIDSALLEGQARYVMDFNSDGKADILVINDKGDYKVLTVNFLSDAPWAQLEVIGNGNFKYYEETKQILFGDYNGDGKTDLMMANAAGKGQDEWTIYYSNPKPSGGLFFSMASYNIVEYRPDTGSDYDQRVHMSNYYAMDINKDGKTDLVRVWKSRYQKNHFFDPKDNDTQWVVSAYINNLGYNNTFPEYYSSPSDHHSDDNSWPIALTGNYKYHGLDSELLIIRYHSVDSSFPKTVTYVDFKKDLSNDMYIKTISQSNGAIVDNIEYRTMEPDLLANGDQDMNGFYTSDQDLPYPLIDIKQLPTNRLVSKLSNTSLGITKKQIFKYKGLSVNLNGIGIVGFRKTARSTWFVNDEDKKTWSFSENSPELRGANLKTTNLLIQAPGNFSFATNYTTGIISTTENQFQQSTDLASKRYVVLLKNQKSTDVLTNVTNETNYDSYSDDYFLPTSVTSKNYLGNTIQETSTTTKDYYTDVSGTASNYYIGRPSEVITTTNAYNNTQTASQIYTYENGNLVQTEKNANSSPITLVEKFTYFETGLLASKKISATGTTSLNAVEPRTTSYTYDETNRFVKTITDTEGLVTTNLTYHPLYGVVESQQNPFNQISTSEYDSWGKRKKVTDFLGKSIDYTYERSGDFFTTTQKGSDDSASMVKSDVLGRVINKGTKDINGIWNYVNSKYDFLGRKISDGAPSSNINGSYLSSTYEYDEYNRVINTSLDTGKSFSTSYNGLTISVQDGPINKQKVMNANGDVVSATETQGGTILYTYDAAGNLILSNYDGITVSIEYDEWGRKKQLVDSSAGPYSYTYNAFGETLTETTPKGTTTYTYSSTGKVLTKKIEGLTPAEKTDITSTYTYDPDYKWLTNITVINPNDGDSSYDYSYDVDGTIPTLQLKTTVETLPFATFTKSLDFDGFGRVETETSTALAHGKTSTKVIKNTYKNGYPWQILDNATQTVLYQIDDVNSRGQLINSSGPVTTSKIYDDYGYVTQIKTKSVFDDGVTRSTNALIEIMKLNTSFNTSRGNLTSRNYVFTNSLTNTATGEEDTETFFYDQLDRLKIWNKHSKTIASVNFSGVQNGTSNLKGFTSESNGILVVANQKLKVTATAALSGVKRLIATNLKSGAKLTINVEILKTDIDKVEIFVVEENPTNNNTTSVSLGLSNTDTFGHFAANYTSILTNSNIYIKFVKSLSSNDVGSTKIFTVDYFNVTRTFNFTQDYDNKGKITANNLGDYNYTNTSKPFQNTSVTVSPSAEQYYTNRPLQNISYNAFKCPIEINEENIDRISFGYSFTQERNAMFYGNTDIDKLTRPYRKYYSGDGSMEVKYTVATNEVEFITYIGGDAYSSNIVYKTDGVTTPNYLNYFYLHRDYQGSILAITNGSGEIVEKRVFDPWGSIVSVQDGAGNNLSKLTFFDRGYTGHEHLESVGLINMNARLYDPKLHRFLSPDNNIQDPYNTQNYNRYAYCINNPLKYTDPSGEIIESLLIGAGIGLVAYLTMNLMTDTPITLKGALMATFIGAVSGGVTCGIGDVVAHTASFTVKASLQALMHGAFQGTLSGIQGGGFWAGAAAGALSSIASSVWQGDLKTENGFFKENNWAYGSRVTGSFAGIGGGGTAGMIAFGTVMGGAGAALTGGNFWNGAVTGLVVSGLNHAMNHGIDPPGKKAPTLKEANKFYKRNNGKISDIYQVDASSVDLNFVDTTGWVPEHVYKVQTLVSSSNGLVFGKLRLLYKGNNQVKIMDDVYDFNQEPVGCGGPCCIASNLGTAARNVFTAIGNVNAGNGTPFTFRFSGLNTIAPRSYNFERGPKY